PRDVEPLGNGCDLGGPLGTRHVHERRQLSEAVVRLEGPADAIRLTRATPRLQMSNQSKQKVVREQIWPGHDRKKAGRDEQEGVGDQPSQVIAPSSGND